MTLRLTGLSLAAIFNLIAAIFSIIAFVTTYPTLALTYFFVSVPLTLYLLNAKPNKVLDTPFEEKWADMKRPAKFSIGSNPF